MIDLKRNSKKEPVKATGLRTGIEAYTVIPTIAMGRGYKNMFFQLHTGLIFRTNNYSNGLRFYVEGGHKFFNTIWLIAFVDILDSFENGNIEAPLENQQTLISLNDNEYGGFGIKFLAQITPKFGITSAVAGAFSAHLEAHRASLNFGFYYKIKKQKNKN